MVISPCPICGRTPVIKECPSFKKYKNGIRCRSCTCPKLCSVVPTTTHLNSFGFIFEGEGDNNTILKEWNKAIACYKYNQSLPWSERWDKWTPYIGAEVY